MESLVDLFRSAFAVSVVVAGACVIVWNVAPPVRRDGTFQLITLASLVAMSGLFSIVALLYVWRYVSLHLIT